MSSLSDDDDELLRDLHSGSSRREEEEPGPQLLASSPVSAGLSLSDDDDDELKSMLSGTDSTPANSQFVLMHEEDLRLVQGEEDSLVATAGAQDTMAASEHSPMQTDSLVYRRPSQESAAAQDQEPDIVDDSLDRSMLLGGSAASSELIEDDSLHQEHKESEPRRDPPRLIASDVQVFPSGIHSPVPKPLGPQELQERLLRGADTTAFMPSLASLEADRRSSGSGSGRVQDDELSTALGVRSSSRSSGTSASSARSAGSNGPRIRRPSTLMRRDPSTPADSKPHHHQDSRPLSGQGRAQRGQDASAASNPWLSSVDAFSSVEREVHRRESEQEVGWTALNDLLRKNALPVLRFNEMTMHLSLGADAERVIVPDRMSVFDLVQEVVSQLERKNQVRMSQSTPKRASHSLMCTCVCL